MRVKALESFGANSGASQTLQGGEVQVQGGNPHLVLPARPQKKMRCRSPILASLGPVRLMVPNGTKYQPGCCLSPFSKAHCTCSAQSAFRGSSRPPQAPSVPSVVFVNCLARSCLKEISLCDLSQDSFEIFECFNHCFFVLRRAGPAAPAKGFCSLCHSRSSCKESMCLVMSLV